MDIPLHYSPEQLAAEGSAPHGGDGAVLMKADLQPKSLHYGQRGPRSCQGNFSQHSNIATARSIALFPQRRSLTRDKGSSLLVNTPLSAQCSYSTAAKPTAEQKNDESPEKLPQAKGPLWVSPGAAKGKNLITLLMAQASDWVKAK